MTETKEPVPKGDTTVTIYTDGACSGNPGPGGWGALLVHGDTRKPSRAASPPPPTTAWS